MRLPKELTTITPLSKTLAVILFIVLPIVGFFLGVGYQEKINLAKHQEMEANLSIPRTPTPTPLSSKASPTEGDETANWKTYANEKFGFEFQYPEEFSLKEGRDVSELNYQSGIIFSGPELRSDMVTLFFNVHNNPQLLNLDDYIINKYGKGSLRYKALMENEIVSWVHEKMGTVDIWKYRLVPNWGGV